MKDKQPRSGGTDEQPMPHVDLLYKEPEWSSPPVTLVKLEVIKQGTVIEHTHGSFVNKKRCKPSSYTSIYTGDVIKFGESTRLYVLVGGNERSEDRSTAVIPDAKTMSSAFVSYFTSASKDGGGKDDLQKRILESRGSGWGPDDKFDAKEEYDDDEERVEDGHKEDGGKRVEEPQGEDEEDDDYFDRTQKTKDRWQKEYLGETYDRLLEIKKTLDSEKEQLMVRFKQSTDQQHQDASSEDTDDSLEAFMSANEKALKRSTQQQVMGEMMEELENENINLRVQLGYRDGRIEELEKGSEKKDDVRAELNFLRGQLVALENTNGEYKELAGLWLHKSADDWTRLVEEKNVALGKFIAQETQLRELCKDVKVKLNAGHVDMSKKNEFKEEYMNIFSVVRSLVQSLIECTSNTKELRRLLDEVEFENQFIADKVIQVTERLNNYIFAVNKIKQQK
eukprot:gene19422-23256_t